MSRNRLHEVERELATLEEALAPLQMRHRQEKDRVDTMRRSVRAWGDEDCGCQRRDVRLHSVCKGKPV